MYILSRARPFRQTFGAPIRASPCSRIRLLGSAVEVEASFESNGTAASKEAYLFIDSVFPIRFGTWDLRHYIGIFREDHLLQNLHDILCSVNTHSFRVLSLEPQHKDGGVFVKFAYKERSQDALDDIVKELNTAGATKGGFPTWTGLRQTSGRAWIVRGKPWREDLRRFPSTILKVAFQGPDVLEEGLYEILRPYGRILDITPPLPGSAGTLRSSLVTFWQARASATARNCIHGLNVPSANVLTRLYTQYERPLRAHAIRDWITGHPRLMVPVFVFLIGAVTYTVFDPIRALVVEGKLLDWFDYRKSGLYKWLRANTIDRLSFALTSHENEAQESDLHSWKERRDAEERIRAYLNDFPNTVAFVHGPQGSGKSSMLSVIMKDSARPVLTVDCSELFKAHSDSALLSSLARQTGYWPVFPFINSLNNLIDVASMGVIGQKAGLSSSLETQVQQMLEVVGTGLKKASTYAVQDTQRKLSSIETVKLRQREEAKRRAAMLRGTWHDPRLDCVAGVGVMSELGLGDEFMRPEDLDEPFENPSSVLADHEKSGLAFGGDAMHLRTPSEFLQLKTKPIVIIKNFETRRGRDDILSVLAKWAATLVENGVAHVIVSSDNREIAKELARALPSKFLHMVALSDAEASSALTFVEQRLRESGISDSFTPEQRNAVERLGGRASDLQALIHKVRSGQRVEDAVEDIITRGVYELRKTAFGEDAEDIKTLPWSREEAWAVLKKLAKTEEVSYHDVLSDFPFKGDEAALRNMEHSDLIIIGTHDGRPSTIRAGRPVYRYVFQRLVADSVFYAIQEMSSNSARIASAESTVRSCEEELSKLSSLKEPVPVRTSWLGKRNPSTVRATYLLKKMQAAETTIEKLEATNAELQKVFLKSR
ncbi:YME2 [Sanghuangporus sanghuang]